MLTKQLKQCAVQLKPGIKRLILKIATATGRYQPFTKRERECVQREAVPFVGDIPKCAGHESNQYRLEYKIPRLLQEEVKELLYTPTGMGWWHGKLYERFSLRQPAIKDVLMRPLEAAIELPQATVVQVETPCTYGDWVSEHIMCLVKAMPLSSPLLMPKQMMDKFYVRRDLEQLGIEAIAVEQPILIHQATILHKTRHSHYITQAEVEAYQRVFAIAPVQPRPGSMIYLSRLGQACEGYQRQYPSQLAADVLQELGAKVVLTKTTTLEEYRDLADQAETVVADFGSALLNLLLWNTKNVIVLFTDDWWDGCALFIAKALGISNVVQICVQNISHAELRRKLVHHLAQRAENQVAVEV